MVRNTFKTVAITQKGRHIWIQVTQSFEHRQRTEICITSCVSERLWTIEALTESHHQRASSWEVLSDVWPENSKSVRVWWGSSRCPLEWAWITPKTGERSLLLTPSKSIVRYYSYRSVSLIWRNWQCHWLNYEKWICSEELVAFLSCVKPVRISLTLCSTSTTIINKRRLKNSFHYSSN